MKLSLMTFMAEVPLLVNSEAFDEKRRRAFETMISDVSEAGFEYADLISGSILRYGVSETAALLRSNHLSLNCVIAMAPFERKMTEAEFASVAAQIDAASELGSPLVMLVPGNCGGDRGEAGERLAENLGRAVKYAGSFNITCVIEDYPALNLPMCRAEELLELTKRAPGLKIVFDTANVLLVDEDPAEDIEKLIGQTVHLHLKDIRHVPPGTPGSDRRLDGGAMMGCRHGSGVVDFEEIFNVLRSHGYSGSAAIEYAPEKGVPQLAEFKRLRNFFERGL